MHPHFAAKGQQTQQRHSIAYQITAKVSTAAKTNIPKMIPRISPPEYARSSSTRAPNRPSIPSLAAGDFFNL
jgi:hypothetical protein